MERTPSLDARLFGGHEVRVGAYSILERNRSHDDDSEAVTIVSQCSLDRWTNILELISSHDGPCSIAVYIPSMKGTLEAFQSQALMEMRLQGMRSSERLTGKMLVISYLYANHKAKEGAREIEGVSKSVNGQIGQVEKLESPHEETDPYLRGYPINALRNTAIAASPINRVMLVDGDFVPSAGLGPAAVELLKDHSGGDRPIALVIPAFETVEGEEDLGGLPLPSDKKALREMWRLGKVRPFHCGEWPPAKASIDFDAWIEKMDDHHPELDEAIYHEYWEPVCILDKSAPFPHYDSSFRGYGLNKVQHSYHLHHAGYRFMVARDLFVVTRPHVKSISYQSLKEDGGSKAGDAYGEDGGLGSKRRSSHDQKASVEKVYAEFKAGLMVNVS